MQVCSEHCSSVVVGEYCSAIYRFHLIIPDDFPDTSQLPVSFLSFYALIPKIIVVSLEPYGYSPIRLLTVILTNSSFSVRHVYLF